MIEEKLSLDWHYLNIDVFGGALREAPTISLDANLTRRLGEWNPVRRTIRFSARFVNEAPWLEVLEVLKHEMAHQYVSDVLGVTDETAHGPAFRMVCKRYGIDHRAAGRVEAVDSKIIERAKKLLALSRSPNRNEAEAALAALQKLRSKYDLSTAALAETPEDDGFVARALGRPCRTIDAHHHAVAGILGRHFRVRPIWIRMADPRSGDSGNALEIVGRPSDVDLAEYVYGWLHQTAESLCPAALKKRERIDYLHGVIRGFEETLSAEGGAIVKVDDDADLTEFFERRYPHTRRSGGRGRMVTSAYFEGQAQGRALKMNRPIDGGGPRLLGGGDLEISKWEGKS